VRVSRLEPCLRSKRGGDLIGKKADEVIPRVTRPKEEDKPQQRGGYMTPRRGIYSKKVLARTFF